MAKPKRMCASDGCAVFATCSMPTPNIRLPMSWRTPRAKIPAIRFWPCLGRSASFGEIPAKDGVIQQTNFDGYQMARMNNAPRETHVHLVESDAPPAGIGEPGVPPFTPALCNAVFAATGKRVRELPFSKIGLA